MNQFQEDPLKSAIHIMDHLILCQERRINSTFEISNIFKKFWRITPEFILSLQNSLKVKKAKEIIPWLLKVMEMSKD